MSLKVIKPDTGEKAIYAHSGNYDITAAVDFTALINEGRRLGLEVGYFNTRDQYFLELGLKEVLESTMTRMRLDPLREARYRGFIEEYRPLLNPFYKVLIQRNFSLK